MPDDRLVWIKWVDSSSWAGWRDREKFIKEELLKDDLVCESVGWVIHEDRETVTIVKDRASCGSISDVMRIPRKAILEIQEIV